MGRCIVGNYVCRSICCCRIELSFFMAFVARLCDMDWSSFFLLSYLIYAEVMRENAFLSRTIEIQENQKVIDTGLYGIVRHPMYSVTLIMFLSIPLILGSVISFAIMLAYIPIIAVRMNSEEQVLEEGLRGYKEYKQRVRYKVIPFVW